MSIFDRIKGIFGRKRKVEPPIEKPKPEPLEPLTLTRPEDATLPPRGLPHPREPLPPARRPMEPLAPPPPRPYIEPLAPPRLTPETQRIDDSNLKAKIDLLITQMDSIKTQNKMIDERLKTIEKKLTETRGIRYY